MKSTARFLAFELLRWLAIYGLYMAGREVAIPNERAAVRHTESLVAVERSLDLFREESVQDGISATFFGGALDAFYMAGFGPVCAGALVWTAWRHRDAYLAVRSRLFAALALATPFFILFPAAPPRLVGDLGIADTAGLSAHDTGSVLGLRFNPYAAMPSLHVGWSLLVALALVPLVRRPAIRLAIALYPALMVLTVVATGNHLFLDVAVGLAIALAAGSLVRIHLTARRKVMSRKIWKGALAGLAGASLLAAAGCGGGGKAIGTTTQHAVATQAAAPSPCETLFASKKDDIAAGRNLVDALGYLGATAPTKCRSLDELDRVASEALGESRGHAIVGGVSILCRTKGAELEIDSTQVCRDAAAEGPGGVPGAVVEEEKFDGGCAGWSTDRDRLAALSCSGGAYRVLVRNPAKPQESRLFLGEPYSGLSVAADSRLVAPAKGEFEFQGVSCWGNPQVGYLFLVSPDGTYSILREDVAKGHRKLLKEGASLKIKGVGGVNRLRAQCRGGSTTVLQFVVNGTRVATARDRHGEESFMAFGVFVGTSEPKTDARFDNVVVKSL